MLLNLSKSLNNKEDLANLAILGLGIEENKVDTALQNHPGDINSAANQILKQWRNGYENTANAYSILCKALRKVKLDYYIKRLTET